MEVKLTVYERLVLLNILPKEGNLLTMRLVQNLRHALGLSEHEVELLSPHADEHGKAVWRTSFGEDERLPDGLTLEDANSELQALQDGVSFDFKRPTVDMIVARLKELDKEGKIMAEHLSLCDKFEIE